MEYRKKEETLLLAMSEVESFHDVVEDEVHFREDVPRVESPTPPTPITSNDMDVIIKGWEIKFEQISRCLREVQLASEKANSDMFSMTRDGRARENHQERRIEAMHVGITEFLERCDPAHLAASGPLDAPTARVRRSRRPRRQGYRPDYVRISTFNHLLSARTNRLNLRAARIRASEIATTLRDTRASENTMILGTRASEITTTLEICATTTSTTLEIGAGITDPTNSLHTKMIEGIAVTCSETHTIVE